ncbi:discoidin domain-containing protein [Geomonas sp. RF6]|uniref:discoidin domain-containing protein n=1 Tax=Geomonas sp. RF6 TaxID=2897342 RepID=UPI001E28B95D|nr:discoidin domain-containing protein [Geomonas sp. RF6]UFS71022.1 discoidin domain-containing protein [Geomonas sp. RF6]
MRKTIIAPEIQGVLPTGEGWLDLEMLAQAELTSESPSHRLEGALRDGGTGWRAAEPGEQTVRLLFERPLRMTRILLAFREDERERTQEFLLRWSADNSTYHDIVRQQYNFSLPNSTEEVEEYTVDLSGVVALELKIVPDMSGGSARASIAKLKIAGST